MARKETIESEGRDLTSWEAHRKRAVDEVRKANKVWYASVSIAVSAEVTLTPDPVCIYAGGEHRQNSRVSTIRISSTRRLCRTFSGAIASVPTGWKMVCGEILLNYTCGKESGAD